MIPADLLDQLREKDPELWSEYQYTELAEVKCADTECGYVRSIEQNDLIDEAQDAWLQHCLMQAIRARGWEFVLKSVTIDGIPGFEAIVYRVRGERRDIAYTETEALLGAYLAAIP